jgi:septum formation protein
MSATATPLWRGGQPLLLASASTARRALLEGAGIPVDTMPAKLDERARERDLGADATPAEIAAALAELKAAAIAGRHPGRVVVGADQVLALDGRTMSKPLDAREAAGQISALSGRTHQLHSAVAILSPDHAPITFVADATLTMRMLDEAGIAAYVARAGAAVCWSPGGYQVEGLGIHLFAGIDGDHSTILGLPMLPLLAALRQLGLLGL